MTIGSISNQVAPAPLAQSTPSAQVRGGSDPDGDGDGAGHGHRHAHRSHGGGGRMQQALMQALQSLSLIHI